MISICLLAGRRIGIGPAPEMIYLARQHIGAVVVNANGLVSTCEAFDPAQLFAQNSGCVRVPQLATFQTVHTKEWN